MDLISIAKPVVATQHSPSVAGTW
ncbi:hypothetical protein M0802_010204 [Mischocyttarus mexicanus]|nr:hypothetical protein M0802_010204 [Mischocyttarus mexicanus]